MHFSTLLPFVSLLALSSGAPVEEKRAVSATCPSYTIISTRGTGEAQGASTGFRTMNSRITSALSGGKIYNTVYPAGSNQDSSAGTRDIVNKIQTTLRTNPNECFILQGYSQGAQATVNAMSQLTGANFNAVKGVFLIGNPAHKSGLVCNFDNNGGTTTRNVNGLNGRFGTGIPSTWVPKTRDICIRVSLTFFLFANLLFLQFWLMSTIRVMVFVILPMDLVSTLRICDTEVILVLRTLVLTTSPHSLTLKDNKS
jgi:hypothetical protein